MTTQSAQKCNLSFFWSSSFFSLCTLLFWSRLLHWLLHDGWRIRFIRWKRGDWGFFQFLIYGKHSTITLPFSPFVPFISHTPQAKYAQHERTTQTHQKEEKKRAPVFYFCMSISHHPSSFFPPSRHLQDSYGLAAGSFSWGQKPLALLCFACFPLSTCYNPCPWNCSDKRALPVPFITYIYINICIYILY